MLILRLYVAVGFCLLLWLHVVKGVHIFESCINDLECPNQASCRHRWCDGKICLCDESFTPSSDYGTCVKAKDLTDDCDDASRCSVPYSECLNGTCQCHDGYVVAHDKKLCKPESVGTDRAAILNEYCDGTNVRCSGDYLTCVDGRCSCEENFRNATKEEMRLYPFILHQCLPDHFKMDENVNISGVHCLKPSVPTFPPVTTLPTTTISTTFTNAQSSSPTPSKVTNSSSSVTTTLTSHSSTASPSLPQITNATTSVSSSSTPIIAVSKSSTMMTNSTSTQTTHKSTTPSTAPSSTLTSTPSTVTTPTSKKPETTHSTSQTTSSTKKTSTLSSTETSSTSSTKESTSSSVETSSSTSHSLTSRTESTSYKATQTSHTTEEPATPTVVSITTEPVTTEHIPTQKSQATTKRHKVTTKKSSPSATYIVKTSTTENTTVVIGNKCGKCQMHARCEADSCGVHRCRCKLGYAPNPTNTECWKLMALGEECSEKHICQGPFTTCDGVCKCADEYEPSDNGRWCRLQQNWFIEFPLLGEPCSGKFTSACYMEFEQDCTDGSCRCKEGLRGIEDGRDRNAAYPAISQCRNDSYNLGFRPSDLCENQSPETDSSDIYNQAKSKIRKMQGAIIGGSIGGVSFLGILVGIIALVRWKRRERKGTFRDTSSTASTEGQRSRYSFKIPRPFANYMSQKEYDSNQISYPSTNFDSDISSSSRADDIQTDGHNSISSEVLTH